MVSVDFLEHCNIDASLFLYVIHCSTIICFVLYKFIHSFWRSKRKFASVDKLKEHEKASALHKQNLAKLVEQDSAKNAPPPVAQYRDRAQERRQIFGNEANEKKGTVSSKKDVTEVVKQEQVVTTVTPQETLLETNIGNKMLQKLGWKGAGAVLGRNADQEPAELPNSTADNLKRDWERIETMASQSGEKRQKAKAPTGLGSI
jgi:hypothetical protein